MIDPILDLLSGFTKFIINKVNFLKGLIPGMGPDKPETAQDAKDKISGEYRKQTETASTTSALKGSEAELKSQREALVQEAGRADPARKAQINREITAINKKLTGTPPPAGGGTTPTTPPPSASLSGHGSTADEPGGEDKHKAVKVSGANMSGVAWNKLGGKDTIEDAILTTWNQAGVSGAPTFTSGLRKKDQKESLANPRSQHIQGTAFDLRSKDLGSKGPAVFADIKEKFAGMGLWGQWEKGDTNAKNRTGEHFHFQLAAKGFGGIVNKATGFIAGEEGPEMVNIIPLQSPADKMNAMNNVHADRATLGDNQASPTIIASETTNASVQSNPLTYVSGASSARGKPIPTSRGT